MSDIIFSSQCSSNQIKRIRNQIDIESLNKHPSFDLDVVLCFRLCFAHSSAVWTEMKWNEIAVWNFPCSQSIRDGVNVCVHQRAVCTFGDEFVCNVSNRWKFQFVLIINTFFLCRWICIRIEFSRITSSRACSLDFFLSSSVRILQILCIRQITRAQPLKCDFFAEKKENKPHNCVSWNVA